MEIKKICMHRFCAGGKKKKIIVSIFLIAIIAFAGALALVAHRKLEKNNVQNLSRQDRIIEGRKGLRAGNIDNYDQFVVPFDASQKGEIAIIVNGFDLAKQNIDKISKNEGGRIYATAISYLSDNNQNGSITVQVPADKFDETFSQLKKVGTSVVQESTQQLSNTNEYPIIMRPMSSGVDGQKTDSSMVTNSREITANSSIDQVVPAIYPAPMPINIPSFKQDKAYIRVVFMDYGKNEGQSAMNSKNMFVSSFEGQNMRNNFMVVLIIKLILLVVLLGILIFIFKRLFSRIAVSRKKAIHHHSEMKATKKSVVHIVRQASRNGNRIVKIKR